MKKFLWAYRLILLIILLILLAGCTRSITDVDVPELVMADWVLMDPIPTIYPVWYVEVEVCLAELARTPLVSEFPTEGNFPAVNWYTSTLLTLGGRDLGGVLQHPNDITMWTQRITSQRSVRHEMAHHIVGQHEIHFSNGGRAVCDSDNWRDDAEASFSVLSPLFMEVTNDNTIPQTTQR